MVRLVIWDTVGLNVMNNQWIGRYDIYDIIHKSYMTKAIKASTEIVLNDFTCYEHLMDNSIITEL